MSVPAVLPSVAIPGEESSRPAVQFHKESAPAIHCIADLSLGKCLPETRNAGEERG